MKRQFQSLAALLSGVLVILAFAPAAHAIRGYGVDVNQTLFDFDIENPNAGPVHTIGNIGFLPEGIDFKPGTNELYAIDIGTSTSQLWKINIANATKTAVGAGFPSAVSGSYRFSPNTWYGFDFIPTTLGDDGHMLIRLVDTSITNLRINSLAGTVAAVDPQWKFGNPPFISAIAYTNNLPTSGGSSQLFCLDIRIKRLFESDNPEIGMLADVGPLGVADDILTRPDFDIYTTPGSNDPGLGGDRGWAVVRRSATPSDGTAPTRSYLLYDVNLVTGALTMGRPVGVPGTPADFEGGFAVLPGVPEPSTILLAVAALAGGIGLQRRRR